MNNATLTQAGSQGAPPKCPWPSPAHEDAFYGLAGEIVREIEPESEGDPIAILIQLLAGIGNVIGRTGHFVAQSTPHFTNLFVVLVGETARARKGSSWGPVSHVLSQVEPLWAEKKITSGLSSGEGMIWNVRDESTAKGSTDPGIFDKRMLVIEEEFASVLKVAAREGNTLSALLRSAWDSKPLRALTKNSPINATGAHISIVGHITCEELAKCLSATDSANGFGNRFVWCCVKRSKYLPEGGSFHKKDINPLVERLRNAITFAQNIKQIDRDDESKEIWRERYARLADEGKHGLLSQMVARREAQVMRLALIYSLLDQSTVIKPAHLNAALALERYAFNSCRYLFGDSLGDPTADTILAALRKNSSGLTRSEITRNLLNRNKSETEITHSLSLIEAAGLATRKFEPTGGRTAERWVTVG